MHTHTFIVFRGVMLFYWWWWCYCCDLLCHYCNCLLENMPATSSIPLQNASTKNNVFFLNARVWCSVSSKITNLHDAVCRLHFHVTCYVALHHTFFIIFMIPNQVHSQTWRAFILPSRLLLLTLLNVGKIGFSCHVTYFTMYKPYIIRNTSPKTNWLRYNNMMWCNSILAVEQQRWDESTLYQIWVIDKNIMLKFTASIGTQSESVWKQLCVPIPTCSSLPNL